MEHSMEHVSRGPRSVLLVLLPISTSLLEPLMLANTTNMGLSDGVSKVWSVATSSR